MGWTDEANDVVHLDNCPCYLCFQPERENFILSHPAYLHGYQAQQLRMAKMSEDAHIYDVSDMD
jgi:hypothetical protein